ncbi:LysR substrate-binding domain-containing protein [Saccharopolyspora elongata]|uniref:LysR family transcriptional regulator n=1 Tax=Saccharopolyspora elongata TaxID=2530387 RepID=A0A4R4Z7Z4_9PSEU|nr:LysR substrate-binding domain-containing protein [Saccharopolyspora elongata]TDD54285.1 LysR family transcriptional regulator [Saccharopolyspora elongata]
MDVHLRHLRYFLAVAEELHFTRAAQRLFVSQPALSKQIRVLERELGFDLFERRSRDVVLTPQGEALLPGATATVAAWERAQQAAREAAEQRELVVGMQTAVGRGLQRRAMRRFGEQMPNCRVVLRLVDWTDPTAGLADGSSDVAFVWRPVQPRDISTRTLFSERRVVALPDDNLLAGKEEIPFADLLDEPFIALPPEAAELRDFWLATDARQGRAPVIGAVAEAADEVFEAIAAGLGVVLLAEGNAELYARPGITTRPVAGLSPAELAIAWRAEDTRPAVHAFLTALAAEPPRSDSSQF